jgi:transposase InsO family protein
MLDWVTSKGIPEEIVTDQGKEFCNDLVKDLWQRLKVRHKTTTPYHPRANGAAERFNATMDKYLRKLMVQDDRESGSWVEYIPSLMVAYNTKVHKGMRTSPFKAMYGYDPNSLYWQNMDDVISDRTPITSSDPLVRLDLDRKEIRDSVKDIMHLNQQHMLRESDRRGRMDKHRWLPRIG